MSGVQTDLGLISAWKLAAQAAWWGGCLGGSGRRSRTCGRRPCAHTGPACRWASPGPEGKSPCGGLGLWAGRVSRLCEGAVGEEWVRRRERVVVLRMVRPMALGTRVAGERARPPGPRQRLQCAAQSCRSAGDVKQEQSLVPSGAIQGAHSTTSFFRARNLSVKARALTVKPNTQNHAVKLAP